MHSLKTAIHYPSPNYKTPRMPYLNTAETTCCDTIILR